jgi:hypothetical protein
MAKRQKDRQHNGQKKKDKKTKQRSTKNTHKSQDRVTRTPLKARYMYKNTSKVSHDLIK